MLAALACVPVLTAVMAGCSMVAADASPWGDPSASRSWVLTGSPGFSGGSYTASTAFDAGGSLFVAFQEYNGGLYNGHVMWNTGGPWVDLGNPDVSGGDKADSITLAIDQGGSSTWPTATAPERYR